MASNKQTVSLLIVVVLALFVVAISLPASNTKAGLATKDYFDAKSQNDVYRDRLGISYDAFEREPTQRDVAYREAKLSQMKDREAQRLMADGHPVLRTPENFELKTTFERSRDNCEPLNQEIYDELVPAGPWNAAAELDNPGGCYELTGPLEVSYFPLIILNETTLDCNNNSFTVFGQVRIAHNSLVTNCNILLPINYSNTLRIWIQNAALTDSQVYFDYAQSGIGSNRDAVSVSGSAYISNVDIDGHNPGTSLFLMGSWPAFGIDNAGPYILNDVAITGGYLGIMDGGEAAEASFTDVTVEQAQRGMRLWGLDVMFSNVDACDNSEWDWTVDLPQTWGSTYSGDLEADTVIGAPESHPSLDLSPCSPFDEVEAEEDVTWTAGDGNDGGNDDDDGPPVAESSPSTVLTSG